MLRLLHSELELLVKSGFIYVPLLFDLDVARELQERSQGEGSPNRREQTESEFFLELEGKPFVKSLSLRSIVANYEKIDDGDYERIRKNRLGESSDLPSLKAISPKGKLLTIVLKIMPYFIRKNRGFERKRLSDDELLDLISSKIDVPQSYIDQAGMHLDPAPLRQKLKELDELEHAVEPLQEGPTTGRELRRWLDEAVEVQILNRERTHLEEEIRERERSSKSKRDHVAALLYIADKGSFELEGFGFTRRGSGDDFFIYKRTGEYILKDYYGRSYLFPDCRVAVPTSRPFRPLVLEFYKHPFLLGHAPKQEICIRGYDWPDEFSAENSIQLLEEGINALLYGYDARHRNGYHSLDPTLYYVKTIEFEDYRIPMDDSQASTE